MVVIGLGLDAGTTALHRAVRAPFLLLFFALSFLLGDGSGGQAKACAETERGKHGAEAATADDQAELAREMIKPITVHATSSRRAHSSPPAT